MHTIAIPEANMRLYMPENLSECDARQYLDMCELILKYQSGILTYEQMKLQAVYRLLNLKKGKSGSNGYETEGEAAKWTNVASIAQLVDTFFTDVDDRKMLLQDYIHNPVPKIHSVLKAYYGPADAFMNVTFGEYTDALRLFMDFSTSGNTRLLYLMAAVLYREKKSYHWLKRMQSDYDGDIRVAYNSKVIETRADALQKCHPGFAYGVFLWFASFQKYITEAVIPWGGRELDLAILFDETPDESPEAIPGIGMDGIAFAIAESGEFGTIEAVRRTNLWEVLVRLYDLKKKDIEYKQKEKDNAKN